MVAASSYASRFLVCPSCSVELLSFYLGIEEAMVALASLGALALLLLSGLSCCSAEACVEPQITPSYYTTSDAVISTETVFIVEISLTCKNRVQVRQWGFIQEGAEVRGR